MVPLRAHAAQKRLSGFAPVGVAVFPLDDRAGGLVLPRGAG